MFGDELALLALALVAAVLLLVTMLVVMLVALVLAVLVALVVWCLGRRPRVESKVWKLRAASGHGGSLYTTGVGVACNDSHACHDNRRAISRRPERSWGRFVETQEMEPPEMPA